MSFNPSNFLFIGGGNPYRPGDFFVHERENNNGKPGRVITMCDGNGDLKEVAQSYIAQGFDPSRIIINGQPATDVFESKGGKDVPPKEDKSIAWLNKVGIKFEYDLDGNKKVTSYQKTVSY